MELQELNNNIESEKYILGTIINNNKLMINAIQTVFENDFYRQDHKYIYVAMIALIKKI